MPLVRRAAAAAVALAAVLTLSAMPALAGLGPQDGHRVTIVVSGPGSITVGGWLSVDPADLPVVSFDLVPNQETLVALAIPNGSSEFAGWAGACSGIFGACSVDMSQDRCLIAAFQPIGGPAIDVDALNAYCPQALGGAGEVAPAPSSPAPAGGTAGQPAAPGSAAPAGSAAAGSAIAPGTPALARTAARLTSGGALVSGLVPTTARRVVTSARYLPGAGRVVASGNCAIRRRSGVRRFTCTARMPLRGKWQLTTSALDARRHVVGQATSILTVR